MAAPLTALPVPEPPSSAPAEALSSATAVPAAVAVPAAPAAADEAAEDAQLDANKLHCYHVALELHAHCSTLVASLQRIVKDQLERASLSCCLNIAEAAGRHSRRDKRRFYSYARGSSTEVAALMDVLDRRRLAPASGTRTGRRLATRLVQMLTRMDQALAGERGKR